MDGKVLYSSYRTYSEQQVLKTSVQLAKSFSKYLFSTAKITRFGKTSFKLMATEIVKIKLYYLNIWISWKTKPRFSSPTLTRWKGNDDGPARTLIVAFNDSPWNHILALTSVSSRDQFTPFCRRLLDVFQKLPRFQQRLILYNAPLFHQYLLQLAARWPTEPGKRPWERGCSVTWSLNGSEAGVDLALIQTSLVLSWKRV